MPKSRSVPTAPTWLSSAAADFWAATAPLIALDRRDAGVLGRYCESFARWVELKDFIRSKGAAGSTYPVLDDAGRVKEIRELPQARELHELERELAAYELRLGIAPER